MHIDSYNKIFSNKSRIMFIFSHPDDAEIYAGGTFARLTNDGKRVASVKMTLGNKGSRDSDISEDALKQLRLTEDKAAMKVLGISEEDNFYLDFNDGEIENSLTTIEQLVFVIRKFKPDIVVTHNPEDMIIKWDSETNWINHRDHRNTGKSVLDACYPYSRDLLFFPEHFKHEGVTSHAVSEFLFVDYYSYEDLIAIDVTDSVEVRTNAIAAHASQYSQEDAQESTDFFTIVEGSKKHFEKFRYVIAD